MSNPFETLEARLDTIEALLHDLKPPAGTATTIDGPVDSEGAARFVNLELPTLYALVQKKKIPFHRRGKKLYFFKDELVTWIKDGTGTGEQAADAAAEASFISANKKRG